MPAYEIEAQKLWLYYGSRIYPAVLEAAVTLDYAKSKIIAPATAPMGSRMEASVNTGGWPVDRPIVERCADSAAAIAVVLSTKTNSGGFPVIDTTTFDNAANVVSVLFHGNLLKKAAVPAPPSSASGPTPRAPLGVLCS